MCHFSMALIMTILIILKECDLQQSRIVLIVEYAPCTSPIMHFIGPPKFWITFVFHFSWVLQPSQEKLKTMLMQNFGGK